MSDRERAWLELCCSQKEKYRIDVDNDCVFVTDIADNECVFEFNHYSIGAVKV